RVERDALDRADLLALRRVEVADALRAAVRIDLVDLRSLRDRLIGADRLADIAVDAFVGDDQGHGMASAAELRPWTLTAPQSLLLAKPGDQGIVDDRMHELAD